MASEVQVMEKPVQFQQHQHQHQHQQQQQQQPQEALKCPRCDSSNTKFCYFNNYSLSQPRHFCKACKRYWTRGGTLRNVPVGGGCRKNKRVKRSITTSTIHVPRSNPSSHLQTNPNPNKNLDHNHNPNNPIPTSTTSNGTSNHHLNPLFYGLFPQTHNYPRFDTRVVSGYDLLQPQTNGLGFSSTGSFATTNGHNSNPNPNPNLTFANYNSSLYNYGGSSSIMASLLASSRFTGFATGDAGSMVKDHKLEETENYRVEWDSNNFHDQNKNDDQTDHDHGHHNSLLWDTEAGTWLDRSVE